MRYRLECRSANNYVPRDKGPTGWTQRDDLGVFRTLDSAYGEAFSRTNDGSGLIFAVVPVTEED